MMKFNFSDYHNLIKDLEANIYIVNRLTFFGCEINGKKPTNEILESGISRFLHELFSISYKTPKDIERYIPYFIQRLKVLFEDKFKINEEHNVWNGEYAKQGMFLGMTQNEALDLYKELKEMKSVEDINKILFNPVYLKKHNKYKYQFIICNYE